MNVLLIGSSGFLGGRIKEYFREYFNVIIYENIKSKKKIDNIDIVISAVGPNQSYCLKYPKKSISQRIAINQKVLKKINIEKLKYYFYLSTIHVYKKTKIIRENTKLNTDDPYGNSHIETEKYLLKYFSKSRKIVILRLSNCFGVPKNKNSKAWKLVLHELCKKIKKNKTIKIKSKENFNRDFLSIKYFLKVLHFLIIRKVNYRVINISSENTLSILEVSNIIKKIFEKKFYKKIKILHKIKNYPKKNLILSKKIPNKIKIKSSFFFKEEIKDLIGYCHKYF